MTTDPFRPAPHGRDWSEEDRRRKSEQQREIWRRRREMAENRYRPFSCGTQFGDWQNSNCCRCKWYNPEGDPECDIEVALDDARMGDGSVSEAIAERMGYLDASPPRQEGFSYTWPCKEVCYTEEWKAEFNARKGERQTMTLPGME